MKVKKQRYKINKLFPFALFAAVLIALQTAQISGQIGKDNPCLNKFQKSEQAYGYLLNTTDSLCKSNNAAFKFAAIVIVGGVPTDDEVKGWTLSIGENAAYKDKYKQGLKVNIAEEYLKLELSKSDYLRKKVINQSYFDVFGKTPAPIVALAYDNLMKEQKSWYQQQVETEIKILNGIKNEREQMIQRAYLATMGRAASADEINYWKPRAEPYKPLVEANRNWLYSPSGKKDLIETVGRALFKKSSKIAGTATINAAIEKYTANKNIFSEM